MTTPFDAFKELCKNRRSIRFFADKPVEEKDILALLELAQSAPNVENLQPWHFHVVTNKALCQRLTEASCYGNFVQGAGVFIVVTVNRSYENKAKETLWNPRELEYSCAAAMENLLLGATAMKLGSSWISLHHGTAHEVLQLPRHEAVVGGIMIGHYRRGEEKPSNSHQRDPLERTYTFHE